VAACNEAAADATGEILIFIHPQTLLLRGWLPPLLRVFRAYGDAGAVGGKLFSPEGKLRHAGGVVFADGTAACIGEGDFQAEAPLYTFVRAVDYCSVAMLGTRRSLFADVRGFDEKYSPGLHLAADYCLRLRELAFRTYFQPDSIGILLDGTEHVDGKAKLNFAKKWRSQLKRQPRRPQRLERTFWQTLPFGGQVQVVDER